MTTEFKIKSDESYWEKFSSYFSSSLPPSSAISIEKSDKSTNTTEKLPPIIPPFPYSYHIETLNPVMTGPFSSLTGTVYATRINRLVNLSFPQVSITGNSVASVINFPPLTSEYTPLPTGTNSFPVNIIQAGVICQGVVNIIGSNITIGSGINCSAYTGSSLLQGYQAFSITYID